MVIDVTCPKPVTPCSIAFAGHQGTMARLTTLALLAAICVGHAGAMYDGEDSPVKMLDAKVPQNADAPPPPRARGCWVAAGSLAQGGAGVRARAFMARCPADGAGLFLRRVHGASH